MDFAYSDKVKALQGKLARFMDEHVYPNERRFKDEVGANRAKGNPWVPTKLIEELNRSARRRALESFSCRAPPRAPEGLANLEYAPLCEIMGRVHWAPEVFNLLRARYRQHGDAGTLRLRGAKEAMARSAASRRDPLGFPYDRTGCRFVRRSQHSVLASSGTQTITSSTAANGGHRERAIRAARSSS